MAMYSPMEASYAWPWPETGSGPQIHRTRRRNLRSQKRFLFGHAILRQTVGSCMLFDRQRLLGYGYGPLALPSRSTFDLPKLLVQPSARFMKPSEQWGCRQQTRRDFKNEDGKQPPFFRYPEGTRHDIHDQPNLFGPHVLLNINSYFDPTPQMIELQLSHLTSPCGHVGIQRHGQK